MKRMILLMICIPISILLNAQIGYQVSLLNSATGEPRANETVTVEVELTDSENKIICSETKSATTNDFGVLSINVGTSSTFENMDWSKLPLYISATVDDILVGRSQILNVPVAEAAKTLVNVSYDILCRTWNYSTNSGSTSLTFRQDGTFTESYTGSKGDDIYSGKYFVHGNIIFLMSSERGLETHAYLENKI